LRTINIPINPSPRDRSKELFGNTLNMKTIVPNTTRGRKTNRARTTITAVKTKSTAGAIKQKTIVGIEIDHKVTEKENKLRVYKINGNATTKKVGQLFMWTVVAF
jgi:hypothetical protein